MLVLRYNLSNKNLRIVVFTIYAEFYKLFCYFDDIKSIHKTKKASTFQLRPLLLLYPQSSSGGFRLSTSTHTAQRIASSAISFRLPSASISAAASFRLTPVFHFRFQLSLGLPFHFLSSASFPLSDPRCFSFLSSASVLDSDYSASALPFLLFPVPPHSCFPSARLRSRFLGLPFLSSLISHAFLPGSCTQLRCSFPFALPRFAPTAVPQVLTSCSRFRSFPFQSAFFRPLLFRFWLLSLCFFLSSFFPSPPHSCFLGASLPLSLLWFSPFSPA